MSLNAVGRSDYKEEFRTNRGKCHWVPTKGPPSYPPPVRTTIGSTMTDRDSEPEDESREENEENQYGGGAQDKDALEQTERRTKEEGSDEDE